MKNLLLLPVLCIALSGCALLSKDSTTAEKAAQVQSLSYAAASIGTAVTLNSNPGYRPAFELAYTNLDALVTTKTINGETLRQIIATLPYKELESPNARIAIESATVLFDALTGNKLNIESQPYVLAAATGIRDGMKTALGK